MTRSHDVEVAEIRRLNDLLRKSGLGGRTMTTAGVAARGTGFVSAAMREVQLFDRFTPENDPHGEHDFGALEIDGTTMFWKIDYYDLELEHRSPKPSNPKVTTRVLTVLLADEW